jgi:threonylcarbamoyladenosine tRNA methylthiotransferase MtaB
MKIAIKTLGCRLNQAESNQIAEKLANFGVKIDFIAKNKADLYIINTCCITEKAVTKSRLEINKIKNRYKKAKILVCGCAQELKSKADFFIEDKNKIPQFIYDRFIKNKKIIHQDTNKLFKNVKTRAFIKIQDGCNNFCAYCIIPYVRRKMVSMPFPQVLKEIKQKEKQGFKEIILTGVNIGKYKNKNLDLATLVKKILKETNIFRIRFGSINPESISDEFISLFKNSRACPHLHLSLQSGSDTVLKRMRRNYTTKNYLNIVKKIYKKYPDFNFTTDIIIGFPGETEKEFRATCKFVEKIGFSKIHIFQYSKREKTLAAKMSNHISYNLKRKRALELAKINNFLKERFIKKMVGRQEEVLLENKRNNYYSGFTKNYFKIRLRSQEDLKNKVKIIKIQKSNLTI